MAQTSNIEWTDATWNPVTGCTKVSAGCDNCYAATLANRLLGDVYRKREPVIDSDIARRDPFAVRIWPERVDEPLGWRTPRMIFVNSMSDLFHADIPTSFVRQVFQVMMRGSWHVYQILTKRPARAARFFVDNPDFLEGGALPEHVWIGTSVEAQDAAYRVRQLRQVPARVRFLSCEPLIGPLELQLDDIQWVIVGGESGITRRPIKAEWVRAIRDQCTRQRIPFFFKQWGGRTPKAGGRELDGALWDEFPKLPATGS